MPRVALGAVTINDQDSGFLPVAPAGSPGGGATQANAAASGAAQVNTATLPATPAKTNYLTGFEVTGGGATAPSIIAVTVTGVVGGPLTYYLAIPTGATAGITPLAVEFPQPLAATGPNAAISVSAASFGVGNTNAAVVAHGYYL